MSCLLPRPPLELDAETLHRIRDTAMMAAEEARRPDETRAPDFGQRARALERLSDAADALHALLTRDAGYLPGPPGPAHLRVVDD